MADWFTDEAERQIRRSLERTLRGDDYERLLAESCLRAGDAHGYRRGLLEAARRLQVAAGRIGERNDVARVLIEEAAELRALADARTDSGQGD